MCKQVCLLKYEMMRVGESNISMCVCECVEWKRDFWTLLSNCVF